MVPRSLTHFPRLKGLALVERMIEEINEVLDKIESSMISGEDTDARN